MKIQMLVLVAMGVFLLGLAPASAITAAPAAEKKGGTCTWDPVNTPIPGSANRARSPITIPMDGTSPMTAPPDTPSTVLGTCKYHCSTPVIDGQTATPVTYNDCRDECRQALLGCRPEGMHPLIPDPPLPF